MDEYDVLVCGLGPVGQLLALLLGDLGVRVLAFDQRDGPYPLPRAAVIDDEVLRILQSVDLDRAILAQSQVQERASIVTSHGRPVEVLRASVGHLGHSPLVSINQPDIEATLLEALASRPSVDVEWGTALDVLDRRGDRVDAYVRPAAGGPSRRTRGRWLVGCDGAASAVRTRLQIPFTGRTAPQRWIVLDAIVDRPLRKVPHPYFVGDRHQPAVTLPMSPGRHRWEWMLRPGQAAEPLLERAALERAMAPWLDGEHAEPQRAIVYTFHTRTAARWRAGRVLLAGDAAHVMPPFAGQGFSSGARDAANLAWKLAAVLDGAPQGLLDTYEAERRPHVRAMQRLAGAMGAFVQATDPRVVAVRDALLETADGGRVHRWATSNVKPLPTYRAGAFPRPPARLPFRRAAGSLFPQTARLDDRLPRGWAAVAIHEGAAARLRAAGLEVVDPGPDRAWLEARGATWALLRPDRFVYACGRADGVAPACRAWQQLIGRAPARRPVAA